MSEKTNFEGWCLVELFGHQKIVGYASEATIAGGAFLRVDVPKADKSGTDFTRYYGASAIYSVSPVSEEIVMRLVESYRQRPVSRYELPEPEREDEGAMEPQEDDGEDDDGGAA